MTDSLSNTIADFPTLQRHVGTWEGRFLFIDPDTGEPVDSHACKLEIGHQGNLYTQRNTYTWEDGRVEVHDFPGVFVNGELVIDSHDLTGFAVETNEGGYTDKQGGADTILFYATYKPESHRAGVDVWDLIRITNETQRYRTWQIKGGDKVVKLCHVDEHRTSSENAFNPEMHPPQK